MTTSSRFHHHACNGLEGVGVGWDNFDSFSSFQVPGFGPMQISTSVWALARISEVLWACFFGAMQSQLLIKLSGFFFLFWGWSFTGLGECDPESLQFPFSGSRVVPCGGFFYQCFASPVKDWGMLLIQRGCKRLSEFSEQAGTESFKNHCLSLWLCVQHIICLQCACFVVSGQICFELVLWLLYFPGHCELMFCLIQSNARISDNDTKKRIDKQLDVPWRQSQEKEMTQETTTLTTTTITTSDTWPNQRGTQIKCTD